MLDIVTTEYKPIYKKMILSLFKKTFQREMSEKFWNWRFENYPYGSPIIRLAFLKDRLIALYLLQPINLLIESRLARALFSMTTMTDPEFAGQGIMSNLANEAYEVARRTNYDLVFGFANKSSQYMFTKKLKFKEIAVMHEVGLDLSYLSKLHSVSKAVILKKFENFYDNYYQNKIMNQLKKTVVNRSSEYLNWRFIDHPENKYFCYKTMRENEFVGYFVLKNYQNIKCHIIDFMINDDIDFYNTMLNQASIFCENNKVNKLTLWINKTLPIYGHISKIGFTVEPIESFFIAKMLSDKFAFNDIGTLDKWYITMGDSDVF